MDGKRLAGAGLRHVVVLEVIGYVWEFDLIVHWIKDIFYNNKKSFEDGPSICDSFSKFSKDCNKNQVSGHKGKDIKTENN